MLAKPMDNVPPGCRLSNNFWDHLDVAQDSGANWIHKMQHGCDLKPNQKVLTSMVVDAWTIWTQFAQVLSGN